MRVSSIGLGLFSLHTASADHLQQHADSHPTTTHPPLQHSLPSDDSDLALVKSYIEANANSTFREASGVLKHPYIVPAGPYDQCWDWDSVFTGTALLDLGSAPYLAGSMKNFFEAVTTTGDVTICVDPNDPNPSCSSDPTDNPAVAAHAKPLLIQGALIAARYTGDFEQFREYKDKMGLLLEYWERERKDEATGLYTWHDQMESGADNLVTSPCPSSRSDCWVEEDCGNSLASADVMTELYREHLAFAQFLEAWGEDGGDDHKLIASNIRSATDEFLWRNDKGSYAAFNTTSGTPIDNDVYLMGFPLFGGGLSSESQAKAISERIFQDDMMGEWGVRSTSKNDPNYNNENLITPYSNWQGPVWTVANAIISYGLMDHGYQKQALDLAQRTITVMAEDIRNSGTWHECWSSEAGGEGLAAEGFLSWNTLGYRLISDIENGSNPMQVVN